MKKKIIAVAAIVMALVFVITGVFAYLTDKDTVTNTFTVGDVEILLDETDVDLYGVQDGQTRVKANTYKLIPGHKYTKDPRVTVNTPSENSYIRMLVTVNNAAALDAIFAPSGANLLSIFQGYDSAKWTLVNPNPAIVDDARTYEFRYYKTVAAPTEDVVLEPLFSGFTVPGEVTAEQLATLNNFKMDIVAHAIQADGFENAGAAWEKFTVPTPTEP